MSERRTKRARKKTGRKRRIGDPEAEQVYAILAVGGSLNDAADYLGIGRRTINDRIEADERFRKGVDRAIAKGKVRLIKKIGAAEPWQAAAWMLERKWGAEFGRKLDVTSGGKAIKGFADVDDGDDDNNPADPADDRPGDVLPPAGGGQGAVPLPGGGGAD